MGNNTFTLTKAYADDALWTEAIMDGIKSDLEAQFNTSIKNNLDQLKADLFVGGYVYDDDGAGNRVYNLENKQTFVDFWDANINLGTIVDANWTDVDATNAAITFVPEVVGKYRVTFDFNWAVVASAGTVVDCDCQFRLIDGSLNASYGKVTGLTSGSNDESAIVPVSLTHIFTFTAASQTIKLQRKITTATNVGSQAIIGSTGEYATYMTVEKI